jgi:hypothetical protein
VRAFIKLRLEQSPDIRIEDLADDLSAWSRRDHWQNGKRLWSDDHTFGLHYVARVLAGGVGAPLSSRLRQEVQDIARGSFVSSRAESPPKPRPAPKRAAPDKAKKAEAKRKKRERAERERKERERRAREEKREEAARRQASAVELVSQFFTTASVPFSIDGDVVRVADRRVAIPQRALKARRQTLDWLDEIAGTYLRDRLIAQLHEQIEPFADQVQLGKGTHGVVVSRHGVPLAVIRPTHAKPKGEQRIDGNFLAAGEHWLELTAWLMDAIGRVDEERRHREQRAAERARNEIRVLTAFPDGVAEDRRRAALAASSHLRTERNLVFGHVVELEFGVERLRFEPLQLERGHVEVPLTWTDGARDLHAALRLASAHDPLPFVLRGDPDSWLIGACWTAALVAYADLTCREDLVTLSRTRRTRSIGGRATRDSAGAGNRRTGSPAATLSTPELQPLGNTARWLTSYVAGHRRRLRPNQNASREAKARARRVGITLGLRETWVSPHVRGVPEDAVLRFRWTPPEELRR